MSDEERQASQWIITTIRRAAKAARRHYRALRKDPTDPASSIFSNRPTGESDPELSFFIQELLAGLTDLERKVMVLSFLQDVPQREIAARLGISQPRVSQIRRAALQRLRSMLREGRSDDKGQGS